MTPLQWEIRHVLKANRDGARTTQYQRQAILLRFARDVHDLGHRGKRLPNIGNRHVHQVVALWKQQGLGDETIKNRLAAIRWLGTKIGKPNLGYDSNARFGLRGRSEEKTSKAQTLRVVVTQKASKPRNGSSTMIRIHASVAPDSRRYRITVGIRTAIMARSSNSHPALNQLILPHRSETAA